MTSNVIMPGATHELWSIGNPDGTRVDIEKVTLAGVPLTYLQFATAYRQTSLPAPSSYKDEFIVAAIGSEWTRAAGMPASGTATYNGQSYGIAIVDTPGVALRTISDFTMTADFDAGSVNALLSNFKYYNFGTGALVGFPTGSSLSINFKH